MPPSVKVQADLKVLLEQLQKVAEHSKKVSEELEKSTEQVGDELANQTKKVETAFQTMSRVGRKIASQMKSDMKALIGVNAVQSGLALNNMFRGSVAKVASLNDAVRKLGTGFGVSENRFARFQQKMMSGLGEIGLSAEDAAKTMEGLAGSGVKGEGNVIEYSKIAGQLTSVGNEKGSEGQVAKALSDVVRSRGGNVNDVTQVQAVAAEVSRAMDTTGASATKILDAMRETYQGASKSGREMISLRGAAQSAIADQITGGNVSGLLKTLTALPPEMRARANAMGLGGIIGKNGQIDVTGIKKMSDMMKKMGTSPELASQIIAGNDEYGDTIMRLIDASDKLEEAFKRNETASSDFADKMKNRRGLKEAFEANINQTTSLLSRPFSRVTQGMTDFLSKTGEHGASSAAVVGGAAALSAMLAAGGARAAMGSVMGSLKGSGMQMIDKDIQKVFVVNYGDIGNSVSNNPLGKAKGIAGASPALAKTLPMIGAGIIAGEVVSEVAGEYIQSQNEKFREKMTPQDNKNMADGLNKIAEAFMKNQGGGRQNVNVTIQNKASQFEAKASPGRGKAQ